MFFIVGEDMDLFSGLIGALIASILTVVYLYFANEIKFRELILIEVIDYVEKVYHTFQAIHVAKTLIAENKKCNISDKFYEELNFLLKTSLPHAKLRIAYGEDKEMLKLNFISKEIREASLLLFRTTKENFDKNDKEIKSIIDKVEVQKELLIEDLFGGLFVFSIIKFKIFSLRSRYIKNNKNESIEILQMRLCDVKKLMAHCTNQLSDTTIGFIHDQIDQIIKSISENEKFIGNP
jgi:hypothetical protein